MDAWNPLVDDYNNPDFNCYDRGPGRDLPEYAQVSAKKHPVTLYVQGIPNEVAEAGLWNMFQKAGTVTRIKKMQVRPDHRDTIGFVTMASVREAEEAMRMYNQFRIHNSVLRVKVALSEEEKKARALKKMEEEDFLNSLPSFQNSKNGEKLNTSDSRVTEDMNGVGMRAVMNGVSGSQQSSPVPKGSGRAKILNEITGLYEKHPQLPGQQSSWRCSDSKQAIVGPGGDMLHEDPALLHVGRKTSTSSATLNDMSYSVQDLTIMVDDSGSTNRFKVQKKADESVLIKRQMDRSNALNRSFAGNLGRGTGRNMGSQGPLDRRPRPGGALGRGYVPPYQGPGYMEEPYNRGYGNYSGMPHFMGRGAPLYGGQMEMMYQQPPLMQTPYGPYSSMQDPYRPEFEGGYGRQPYLLQPVFNQTLNTTMNYDGLPDDQSVCSRMPIDPKDCNLCGRSGAVTRCSRCKTPYCNATCQRRDWAEHKRFCKQIKEANEAADLFESRFDVTLGDEIFDDVKDVVERYTASEVKMTKKQGQLKKAKQARAQYEDLSVATEAKPQQKKQQKGNQSGLQPGSYVPKDKREKTSKSPKSPKENKKEHKPLAMSSPERPELFPESSEKWKISPKPPKPPKQPKPEPSLPVKAKLPFNKPTQVAVSEVVNPYEIWVQNFNETALLSETMAALNEKFTNSQPELELKSVKIGDIFAAPFSGDELWYRARVDVLHPPNSVTVTFIDFGNKETMTASKLRHLEPSMLECPMQAIGCKLERIVPPDEDTVWRAQSKVYQAYIKPNEQYTVVATRQMKGMLLVRLTDSNDNDIAEKLVEVGLAAFPIVRSTRPSEKTVIQSMGCVSDNLKLGQQIQVVITDATSPMNFSVQVMDTEAMKCFQAFDAGLNQVYNLNKETSYRPENGELVVALYSADQKWYRAEVIEMHDTEADLHFIDYGNLERAKFSAIRKANDAVATVAKQAMKCCLCGLPDLDDDEWSQDALRAFAELLSSNTIKAVVKAVKNKVISLDMKSPASGKSVSELLKSMIGPIDEVKDIPAPEVETEKLPLDGSVVPVEISHFTNLGSFYVQIATEESKQSLSSLMQKIAKVSSESNVPYKPSIGELVCAEFSQDKTWYRAVVEKVSKNNFRVIFIDFGNSEDVSKEAVRKLDDPSLKGPGKAIHCQLEGVTDPADKQKINKFSSDLAGKSLRLRGKHSSSNCFAVELYTDDDLCVNNKMGYIVSGTKGQVDVKRLSPQATRKPTQPENKVNSVQLPVDGSLVSVELSHFESLANFYVQIATDESKEKLASLVQKVDQYCSETSVAYRPVKGEVVGVQYSVDHSWYRGRVEEVLGENTFLVYFIDYGNEETVVPELIRKLDPVLCEPGYAVHCRLVEVTEPTNPEKIQIFGEFLQGHSFQARGKLGSGGCYDVELVTDDNTNINAKLGCSVQATKTTSQPEEAPNIGGKKPSPICVKSEQLPLDASLVPVVLTHFENLGDFYIQLSSVESRQALDAIMKEVAQYCSKANIPYSPEPGELVCALFSSDKTWYRARVEKAIGRNKFHVCFIDYGNEEIVTLESIRKLDPQLCEPGKAIHCRLEGVTDTTDQTKIKMFVDCVNGSSLQARGRLGSEDHYSVELITNGNTSVNEKLKHSSLSLKSQPAAEQMAESKKTDLKQEEVSKRTPSPKSIASQQLPLDGSLVSVELSNFVNLGDFYVQITTEECKQSLSSLMQKVEQCCFEASIPYSPAEGEMVCAKFTSDNKWYRGRVEKVFGENQFHIFFIDYGNGEILPQDSIRKFSPDLCESGHAIHCGLEGVTDTTDQTKIKTFVDCLNGSSLQARGRLRSEDYYSVELITDGNTNVNEKLGYNRHSITSASATEQLTESKKTDPKQEMFERTPTPKPIASAQLPLDGNLVSVELSDFENLANFCIQIATDESRRSLASLMQKVAQYCSENGAPYIPVEGEVVCAKFSSDKSWYRARVEKIISGNQFHVCFIDYGNGEIVTQESIRKLGAGLDEDGKAIHCRLKGVTDPASLEKIEAFVECFRHCSLQAKGKSCVDKLFDVELYADGKSINTQLGFSVSVEAPAPIEHVTQVPKEKPAVEQAPRPKTPTVHEKLQNVAELSLDGRWVGGVIQEVIGLDSFYIQLADEELQRRFALLMAEISQYCTNDGVPYKPSVGEVVCAQFSDDNQWYRAQVMKLVEENVYIVFFLDYGNTEMAMGTAMRKMLPRFHEEPFMAIQCKLAGSTGKEEEQKLVALRAKAQIKLQVKALSKENDSFVVELMDGKNKKSIGEQLELQPVSDTESGETASQQPSHQAMEQPDLYQNVGLDACTFPADGSSVQAQITYINGLESFFMQIKELETLQKLDKMRADLDLHCRADNMPYQPSQGEIVCALYSVDNAWYRARVEALEQNKCTVYFIDYGNLETIKFSSVRKLVAKFRELPEMAIHCKLAGMINQSVEDPVDKFATLLQEAEMEFKTKPVKCVGGVHDVLLYMPDGRCVSEILGFAVAEVSPETKMIETAVLQQPDATLVPIDLLYSTLPCDGRTVQTKITHAVGADSFYVQLVDKSLQNKLELLMASLNQHCSALKDPYIPQEGEIVCALFSQDGCWYRARCEERIDNQYLVYFVDYGNSESVAAEHIRLFAKQFQILPAMAIHCQLEGFTGSSQDKVLEFATFIKRSGGVFTTKASKIENNINYVQLFTEDGTCVNKELGYNIRTTPKKRVSTSLVEHLPKALTPLPDALPQKTTSPPRVQGMERKVIFAQTVQHAKPVESEFIVIVTHVTSPALFHCQIPSQEGTQALALLTHSMGLEGKCEVDLPSFDIAYEVGELCCAKFSGGEWYRASIQQVFPDQTAEVEFVDFGNREVVPLQSMRPIRDEHIELPILAFKCCLAGVKPNGSYWCAEAVSKMKQYENVPLSARLIQVKNDMHELELTVVTDGKQLNVAENLMKLGLARDPNAVLSLDTASASMTAAEQEMDEKERLQRENAKLMKEMLEMKAMMAEMQKKL